MTCIYKKLSIFYIIKIATDHVENKKRHSEIIHYLKWIISTIKFIPKGSCAIVLHYGL